MAKLVDAGWYQPKANEPTYVGVGIDTASHLNHQKQPAAAASKTAPKTVSAAELEQTIIAELDAHSSSKSKPKS